MYLGHYQITGYSCWCCPKFCERKYTCLVATPCKTIDILNTIYKVCVFLSCTLCEITQRSCRDGSPWVYFYDPPSGARYSSRGWVGLQLQLHLTPGLLDSETSTVCWRVLTCADVCWRVLTCADVCMGTDVCWRVLTCSDVCMGKPKDTSIEKKGGRTFKYITSVWY